jgi:hypothetical protein
VYKFLVIKPTLTLGSPTKPILRLVFTLPKRAAPVGAASALAFGGMLEASHKLVNALSELLTTELSKCAYDESQPLTPTKRVETEPVFASELITQSKGV